MKTTDNPQTNFPEMTVQGILHALSDPTRIAIFVGLQKAESACNCSAFLQLDQQSIPKSTLSQHFKVLREAGLITSEKRGVEVLNRSVCAGGNENQFTPMIKSIITAYLAQLQPQP